MLRELNTNEMEIVSGGMDEVQSAPTTIIRDDVHSSISGQDAQELYGYNGSELNGSASSDYCNLCHTSGETNPGSNYFTDDGGTGSFITHLGDMRDNFGSHVAHAVNVLLNIYETLDDSDGEPHQFTGTSNNF